MYCLGWARVGAPPTSCSDIRSIGQTRSAGQWDNSRHQQRRDIRRRAQDIDLCHWCKRRHEDSIGRERTFVMSDDRLCLVDSISPMGGNQPGTMDELPSWKSYWMTESRTVILLVPTGGESHTRFDLIQSTGRLVCCGGLRNARSCSRKNPA